jgi:predicted Rossmann fold nucleotide-binding protein DprA/Smf involved in DNA uptake
MAVLERTTRDLSTTQRREMLERALKQQDTHAADALVTGLQDLALEAIAANDLEKIAALRAQTARLARRVPHGEDPGVASHALEGFKWVAATLDRGEVAVLLRVAAREREEAAEPIRKRVLALMDGQPWRPRALADQLGCDPSQISRALRELQQEQAVVRVERLERGGDRRAIWYERSSAVTAA